MYYPYLRGKQFELLALREFSATVKDIGKIIPIIEPVKRQFNGLNTAITTLLDNGMKFALILNPSDGDFRYFGDTDILKYLSCLEEHNDKWIPAFIYRKNDNQILAQIKSYSLKNLMIVFTSSADINASGAKQFLENPDIRYVVACGLNNNRPARAELLRLGKAVISLEDKFSDKSRNAEYAEVPDEMFSDDFAYYMDDNLDGFADYTLMSKDFYEGGMLPYAIAIHLTYQKSENQIFVHHFVSDSNYDQSNIRGKFHEAAIKIKPFYDNGGYLHTHAVDELIRKSTEDNGYPGLGYIKKLSLLNHLELMDYILTK